MLFSSKFVPKVQKDNSFLQFLLVGNPNVGKTSLFNALTGLNQKVGNFPGVTVEKKTGRVELSKNQIIEILDLPGTYNLFSQSADEALTTQYLLEHAQEKRTCILFVLDALHLERSLLLYSQIQQFSLPTIVVITRLDLAQKQGLEISIPQLSQNLGKEILSVNPRKTKGISTLIERMTGASSEGQEKDREFFNLLHSNQFQADTLIRDQMSRVAWINQVLEGIVHFKEKKKTDSTKSLDRWILHPVAGYFIYATILFVIFQLLFYGASYPMEWIEQTFLMLCHWAANHLPESKLSSLFVEGILGGLGGIIIFIPQMIFLFAFISFMEETGYMSRVVFLMDRPMRALGLDGKSMVPLISASACAIPAILATRGIEDKKSRLITILVTPFISCSARLPVYIILIGLIIPSTPVYGVQLQGLTLFLLYFLGIVAAAFSSIALQYILKGENPVPFVMDMPQYQWPKWKNLAIEIWLKTKVFLWDAGKIILALSIILWVLASFGPNDLSKTESKMNKELSSAEKLEQSYLGIMGKCIEPIIQPLGYDWKIGIALISSFAAREVFVGTLATIYNLDEEESPERLTDRMRQETKSDGSPVFNFPTGISLLLFYVFSMQCMSTFAVVRKETNTWFWPFFQLVFMFILAYGSAFLAYQSLTV
jgi:ferrous iron transport protein B